MEDYCIIAEVKGKLGDELYMGSGARVIWTASRPGEIELWVTVGGEADINTDLTEENFEEKLELSVPNSKMFLNAKHHYVQKWRYSLPNGPLTYSTDGYMTSAGLSLSEHLGPTQASWFTYDSKAKILSIFEGKRMHLGTIPTLPFGIQIVGTLTAARKQTWNLGPHAIVEQVWVDHNVYQNSQYGMLIHTRFTTNNMKDMRGQVAIYFEFGQGLSLRDNNGSHTTSDGQVAISGNFTPKFTNNIFEDFNLFMPYDELHLETGKHDLRFYVQIYNFSTESFIAKSEYQAFEATMG